MVDKIKGLVKSKRFWTAVGSVVTVCLQDVIGIPARNSYQHCGCSYRMDCG